MKTAPEPRDIQEFQFKQSYTCHVLDAFASVPAACSLLAADRKRGLLYAAQHNKIIVLKPEENKDPKWKLELNVPVAVSKLMLNCDCTYLAVAPCGPLVLIYDAQALARSSLQLLYEIRISTSDANVFVNDLRWNPTVPGMLCTVASDYTLGSFKIKEKKEKTIELKALEKFNDLDPLCSAWSPKGKQIVVGCKNGSLVQFKPDLKVARTIPGPNPYIGEIISILWISNYQFCAAYLDKEKGVNVLIIDAPKGETTGSFTSYEDITYGVSEGGAIQYYFDHVPEWGLIIAASSTSSEVAVLGSADKGVTWHQWQLVDSGRAELPLICTTESYPVGLAIDKSPVNRLPWGADSTLPHPVPILHILATSGQLCSFHMVNLFPNCPPINCPPTEIVSPPSHAQPLNVPQETSMIMNRFVTSTPLPGQPQNVPERRPVPAGNIFDKFLQGNDGFFAQPPAEKPKQQEQKLESLGMEMKLESARETQPQETVKQDFKSTPIKDTVPQAIVEEEPTVEDDAKYNRAYIEEHNLFEKELEGMRNRLGPQTWECGTEEECQRLGDTSTVHQFLQELKEITNSLSSDIAYLKALLLQSFAWVEETKSKNAASNDITRSCGDNNKVSDLQKLYYYTQTQLTQASRTLDLNWSNQKSQEILRMKIPHLEFIYQNLILHSKIIQEERSKLEHFKKQWKAISRNNSIFGLNRSFSNISIAPNKSSTVLPRNAGIIEARCKTIALKTLSFTDKKRNKLREHLSASTPQVVKPVNPSSVHDRLEKTLTSLDLRTTTVPVVTKNKGQPVPKQTTIAKEQPTEKPKQQSPLASLNSIVARIGASETTGVLSQNKPQTKQPSFNISFPPVSGNKPVQSDNKQSSVQAATTTSQTVKPKQDIVPFNQVSGLSTSSVKSFPRVENVTFGAPVQKPAEVTTPKPVLKDSTMKTGKETPSSTDFKVENNVFGTISSLKDALSSENTSEKVRTSAGLNFGMAIPPTTTKSDAMSTFSFASPTTNVAPAKSNPQSTFVAPQTTSAQTFSFASKLPVTATAFNLKMTPSTTSAPQTQASPLNLGGLLSGLQTPNQESPVSSGSGLSPNYKPTFGQPGFQMLLGQTTSINQISISKVSEPPPKETMTTTPSITIEKVAVTKPKTASIPTSPVQTSATSIPPVPLFGGQTNASNISVFGGMSSSLPTTSTFTVTTTTPAVQPTTTSSVSLFSSFGTTSVSSPNANTSLTTGPGTVSPFQASLSKPTFGEAVSASAASSVNTTTATASSTLTFGSIAAASVSPVFGKPASPMNTQFQNATTVSTTANAFGKVTSPTPTFKPFGSPSQTGSIFGQMPPTSSTGAIFSGNNNTSSIFGGNAQPTAANSIFGGNVNTMSTFGSPQKSMFDSNAQKSDSIFGSPSNAGGTSFFGGAANNVASGLSPTGSSSVFGGAAINASPIGVEQPAMGQQTGFGQASGFGEKPIFGSAPTFGAQKPVFGGGFGATAFAASPAPPAFGNPPTLGGTPAPIDNNMSKVFGSVPGSNTFESLASQPDGLSFSSLAQKTAETQKSPVFNSSSSFSAWR
ncbi:nuclear pore complex protein Nup214 [Ceratina calcarata]|uniref:Nuclear pore complex protein Nup214 n=1 Tax=Ceratina calcarata TaxID=156304 RepID=A0AAJ7IZY9_9HYME|nr:nuclear pore complex protein Nup214 [Ceratina calcarata]